ncbi:trigger factor [Myxococcota bacterium]|nr:trigger factor [Myxococcota bacterium]MBU1412836.1 trigger factor [Myxococcota bacterium]MBU1510154.1 trigger factor [Myxococcota bacterium]
MQFNAEGFTIENINPIQIRIQGLVPWKEVEKKFDETYREISKNMRFRGFRKGKVPRQMLEKMFSKHVETDLLQELTRGALVEFLRLKESIRPADNPREWKVTPGELVKGQDLPFSSELELIPEVEPQGYEGLKATRLTAPVKEQSIDEELERLVQRNTRVNSIENATLAAGTHVQLNVMGKLGDEPVSLENQNVTIPASAVPADDSHLARVAAVLFGFHLPEVPYENEIAIPAFEDHPEGRVLVEITKAFTHEKPELDDDFAKETGRGDTLAELRESVGKDIAEELKNRSETLLERELLKQIVEANPFDLGQGLIRRQAEMKVDQILMQLGVDPENEAFLDTKKTLAKNYFAKAEKEIRENLLLEGIAKKENVEISDEALENKLKELADRSNKSVERIKADYTRDGKLEEIRYMLRMEKTIDLIKGKATIAEEKVDELPALQEEEPQPEETHDHECGPDCDHDHH